MAPKGKSPLRKISPLGLDQLLSQIVGQASGQYPPAGTTTTSTQGSSRPGQNRPVDSNGDYIVAEGLPPMTAPMGQPGMAGGSSRPGQNRPLDANGDYFVAEGLPAGATPGTQAAPQAAPMPASQPGYPSTGTTVPSALNQSYAPVNMSAPGMPVDGVNAQPASAPVNGGGSAAPASTPTVSTYRNIGEIYAEKPPTGDPAATMRFYQEKLSKVGKFYGLSDEQIAQANASASGILALELSNPNYSPVSGQTLVSQIFEAEATKIVQANGAEVPSPGSESMKAPPVMQSDQNPLSVYGVYTPEQIAAIQGQIGMYTNQMQDRFSQAAGGWKPSAAMQDAYARQAQAIPAVQALEGQAALAQALAAEKEKNNYYTTLLQQRSSDASSSGGSSGAMSGEDMTNFVNSLTGG